MENALLTSEVSLLWSSPLSKLSDGHIRLRTARRNVFHWLFLSSRRILGDLLFIAEGLGGDVSGGFA